MADIEARPPPAYTEYDGDATLDQSRAYSDDSYIKDYIDTTIGLARDSHRVCIKTSGVFRSVAHEAAALYAILEVIGESLAGHSVNREVSEFTMNILSVSRKCLSDLQALVTRYRGLSTTSQMAWERTVEAAQELGGVKGQIGVNIDLLNTVNDKITSSPPKSLLEESPKIVDAMKSAIPSSTDRPIIEHNNTKSRYSENSEGSKQPYPSKYGQSSNSAKLTEELAQCSTDKRAAALFTAITRDDISRVQELLDQGVHIESRDDVNGGETPLIKAVQYDKVDIVELLLKRGADSRAKTFYSKENALIVASSAGRDKALILLLERGQPDLEARDRNGRTALMRASSKGYEKEILALLAAGADIEAKDAENRTALMEASRFGYPQTVKLLKKKGACNNQELTINQRNY